MGPIAVLQQKKKSPM
jgi:hypothetical protein